MVIKSPSIWSNIINHHPRGFQRIHCFDFWRSFQMWNLDCACPAGWFDPKPRAAAAALGLPKSGQFASDFLPLIMWRRVCRRAWKSTLREVIEVHRIRHDIIMYIPNQKQNSLGILTKFDLFLEVLPQCSWVAFPLTRPTRGTADKESLSFPAPHNEPCCTVKFCECTLRLWQPK